MSAIQIIPVSAKYIREDGLEVFYLDRPELEGVFEVRDTSFVRIPAGVAGGNHKHPRSEAFMALADGLTLHWLDETGKSSSLDITPGSLFVVAPGVAHAVVNHSSNMVSMIEYADGPQVDVVPVSDIL